MNMMEEMDLAAKLQKTYRVDPRALGAKGALEMATIEGARALHMEKEIGSLEAGKKADFVVLKTERSECRADVRRVFADRICAQRK